MHTDTQTLPRARRPNWWGDTHETGWDRVKAALRRDWDQTKADFTGGKQGRDLNQDVGDTVGQMTGNAPIPPGSAPNPLDADEVAAKTRKAQKDMDRQAQRLAEDTERTITERGYDRWDEAEEPMRYGYGAGLYYTDAWDGTIETRLSREWADVYPNRRWDDVRDDVRRGWERARQRA